ncbi:MAG: phosphatase PAP2 family protein [Verrucomicrobiales bacterium]|nr:phosphatase PAP2 family protein [Verrucomicrobiales bacterium]
MDALGRFDLALFRAINRDGAHPFLDAVMRFLSGNPFFWPALIALGVALIWKGGGRGCFFLVTALVAAGLANEFVVEPLKDWVQRPRPYVEFPDLAVLRAGKGNPRGSMPSAHALNMALLATVAGWYYRRSLVVLVPVAVAVGYSRVYNGVHYPSDVLAGWLLGAGTAAIALGLLHRLWRRVHRRWGRRWPRLPVSWLRPASAEGQEPNAVLPSSELPPS